MDSPDLRALLERELPREIARYVDWARTPLGGLSLAAVAAGLCGAFLHQQAFTILGAIAAILVAGAIQPWLSVAGLKGTLSFDRRRCREGEEVLLTLELRNRMPWSAWGLSIREEGPLGRELAAIARAPGRRSIRVEARFIPEARGEYPRGEARIQCGFPFGIVNASRPLAVASTLLVRPRTFPVDVIPLAAEGRGEEGPALRNRPGQWGDPLGSRPYRRGDPIRRAHWPQTARRGQLMICEIQASASPRITIMLDDDPRIHVGVGPDSSLEWAIRVAASLALGWSEAGAEVSVALGNERSSAGLGPRMARPSTLMDAFARFRPATTARPLDRRGLLDRRLRDECVVVVTTDLTFSDDPARSVLFAEGRLVVLSRAGFGAAPSAASAAGSKSVGPTPWILIEGPNAVASRLRGCGKGKSREA